MQNTVLANKRALGRNSGPGTKGTWMIPESTVPPPPVIRLIPASHSREPSAHLELCQWPMLCQLLYPELKVKAEAVENRPQVDNVTRPEPQSGDNKRGHGCSQLWDHRGVVPANMVIHISAGKTGEEPSGARGAQQGCTWCSSLRTSHFFPALPQTVEGRTWSSYLQLDFSSS